MGTTPTSSEPAIASNAATDKSSELGLPWHPGHSSATVATTLSPLFVFVTCTWRPQSPWLKRCASALSGVSNERRCEDVDGVLTDGDDERAVGVDLAAGSSDTILGVVSCPTKLVSPDPNRSGRGAHSPPV